MIQIAASEIAKIVNGKYSGPADLLISGGISFDSRNVKSGDLFLALKGEVRDGHDYLDEAFAKGASLALTQRSIKQPHIQVDDVLVALSKLAREVRSKLTGLKVIGITGSQGKTTTKDILATVLSAFGPTVVAEGSFNNELGVPITLLSCNENFQFCVVEMGARHTGDIAALVKIANPNIGAVLKVGNAHLGEFGSREKIAETKSELVRGLQSGATAILGNYDEFTPKMADGLGLKTILFGESSNCHIRAADIEIRGGYPHFDLVTPDGRERVELQLLGEHQIANALAAAAISFALGMNTAAIAQALSAHHSHSKWRMELSEGRDIVLINDSYNANPESMAAALKTLALITQERGGRSWAFLGTMHELGPDSSALHKQIGKLVAELEIDHLVAIGNRDYLTEAHGSSEQFFAKAEEAEKMIDKFEPGDVLLIKASRAEHLDLLADKVKNFLQSPTGSSELKGEWK
mgnify:FL=1